MATARIIVLALVALAATALAACRDPAPPLEVRVAEEGTATTAPSAPPAPVPSHRSTTGPAAPAPPDWSRVDAPAVVALDPPAGSDDVDPSRTWLAVTFDRPMGEGYAWVKETEETTPPVVGAARWDAARRTNTIVVALEPGREYVLWLNAPGIELFRDDAGRALAPLRWSFRTAAAPD